MDRKVSFNPNIEVLIMHEWTSAYTAARRSEWMEIHADRLRFLKRVEETNKILSPILNKEHREKVLNHRQ